MPSGHVFIAMTLDGFIARPDGRLDWLPMPVPGGEDWGHAAFMDRIDAMVIGRETFDTVHAMGDQWFYSKPVIVLTSRPAPALSDGIADRVTFVAGGPEAALAAAEQQGWQRVGIDGGRMVQSCLAAGLVQDLIVSLVPVLIGAGKPLFGTLPDDIVLSLIQSKSYPDGLVQLRYTIG